MKGLEWLFRRANGKKCAATGRKPFEHLEEERSHLKPLRNSIFAVADKTKREPRKVDKLGQVSVRGAKLRLPSECFASKTVSVFIGVDEVHIFDSLKNEPIVVYSLKTGLSRAPVVRQKSLRQGRSAELKRHCLIGSISRNGSNSSKKISSTILATLSINTMISTGSFRPRQI